MFSILLIGVPMIVLSSFYFGITTGLNDVNSFPERSETKEAFIVFEEEFSFGDVSPAGGAQSRGNRRGRRHRQSTGADGDRASHAIAGGGPRLSDPARGAGGQRRRRPRAADAAVPRPHQ